MHENVGGYEQVQMLRALACSVRRRAASHLSVAAVMGLMPFLASMLWAVAMAVLRCVRAVSRTFVSHASPVQATRRWYWSPRTRSR